ncbi:MAG: E2/UBC family protein [Steroidobacteraceae bacterium]
MTQILGDFHVFINHNRIAFHRDEETGRGIKEHAGIPLEHVLCLDPRGDHEHENCDCERGHHSELKVITDDDTVHLHKGQHFWTVAPAMHAVTVTINRKPFEFADPHQTGRSLKERAGIALGDVLFRDHAKEDEVIADDAKITLKCGDRFHSAPPANYGAPAMSAADVGFERFESKSQPDGWTFLIVPDYPLPEGLLPRAVRLLLKLPPTFPDAAPDMFWLSPQIRTPTGVAPQGTAIENVIGAQWQRFSWHLTPGAWRPGISTLRDYMRCVRARLEKRN